MNKAYNYIQIRDIRPQSIMMQKCSMPFFLTEWSYQEQTAGVEDDGTIFLIFKREDLADMLGICTTTVWRAIKQLKEVGLIEKKRQGLNRPNLIYIGKIDYSVPEEKEPENNKYEITDIPSNNIAHILSSDIENLNNRTFTAERSGAKKNKCQDISKLKPNKTDNNKPEYNDTDNNEPESLNKAEKENYTELNSS